MTNSKNTKRALLLSVLSMMLCAAMLIGSTFAWFTDSVTSGKNKIVAGNLDVELYAKDGDAYTPVIETTNLFMKDALWEPGHVEVVNLKVANLGTLALKYQLGINVASETKGTNAAGEVFKLSDYIKFALIDGEQIFAEGDEGRTEAIAAAEAANPVKLSELAVNKNGVLYPKDTAGKDFEKPVTLVVYMPTTVGNEANYKTGTAAPEINLGVKLVATQTPYESDSFNDQYDKDLPLTWAATTEELKSAIADGGSVMVMSNVDANNVYGFEIKDDTLINGNGNVLTTSTPGAGGTDSRVLDMSELKNKTLTVSDAVIGGNGEASYPDRGISLWGSTSPVLNIDNSTVQAKNYPICIAGGNTDPEVNIRNSTVKAEAYAVNITIDIANPKINLEGSTIEGYAAFQTHSGGVTGTFKNSTFKGVNKWDTTETSWNNFAVIVVSEYADEAGTNLTFDNCTISAEEKGTAIEWFFSLRESCTLNLNGCTFVKNGETVSTEDIITDIQTGAGKYVQIYPNIDVTIFVDGVQIKPAT